MNDFVTYISMFIIDLNLMHVLDNAKQNMEDNDFHDVNL